MIYIISEKVPHLEERSWVQELKLIGDFFSSEKDAIVRFSPNNLDGFVNFRNKYRDVLEIQTVQEMFTKRYNCQSPYFTK